jgi:plasmid stabilization system protein ParE
VPAEYALTPAATQEVRDSWRSTAAPWGERQADRSTGLLETCVRRTLQNREALHASLAEWLAHGRRRRAAQEQHPPPPGVARRRTLAAPRQQERHASWQEHDGEDCVQREHAYAWTGENTGSAVDATEHMTRPTRSGWFF